MLNRADYELLAKPQESGQDNHLLLALAKQRWDYQKPDPKGELFLGVPKSSEYPPGSMTPACDHPNVEKMEHVLGQWPAGARSLGLLDTIWLTNPSKVPAVGARGSSSGHYVPEGPPSPSLSYWGLGIMATVFDPIGGSEGVVHETCHVRLHCLGLDLEDHDGKIIANGPDERFCSPIRRDVLRPMTAVIHAQASYVFVSELDHHLVDETERSIYLNYNIPRIAEGHDEIVQNVKPAAGPGSAWLDAFLAWSEDVIERGNRWLEEHPSPVAGHEPLPRPTS